MSVYVDNSRELLASHLDTLIEFRRHIHSHPELSEAEHDTAKYIANFLRTKLSHPPEIISNIGGAGFVAIFDFNRADCAGPTVIFRCELDALKIDELNNFSHKSTTPNVSHKCGHDGHMAIVVGLGIMLSEHYQPSCGRVVLLFQPAEETGSGAKEMINAGKAGKTESERRFGELLKRDSYIFALHNLPKFPAGSIVIPRGATFASASKGLHAKLTGATSHAAQPFMGKNPALAMCNLISGLLALPSLHTRFDRKTMVTIVGARLGDKAFGVSAGDAEVMATLRATTDEEINILTDKAEGLVKGVAATYDLESSVSWEDVFVATVNDPDCSKLIHSVAQEYGYPLVLRDEAFPFSEDFGLFLHHAKGAMFALGAGEDHEHLHSEYYDFNDDLIASGTLAFLGIVKRLLD